MIVAAQPNEFAGIEAEVRQQEWYHRVEQACAQACAAIAPAWPLDQSIAVNPYWCRIGLPMRQVAARMAVLAGIRVFPARSMLRAKFADGTIGREDLEAAHALLHANKPMPYDHQQFGRALAEELPFQPVSLLIDVLDQSLGRKNHLGWRQAITHQVSQTCATYFDQQQADWQPQRRGGLYAFWLETIRHDHGIGLLMGLPGLGQALEHLPKDRTKAEQWAMQRLGLAQEVWPDYLEAVLLTVQGWASWCAYLQWQARLQGESDEHIRELLAIRLAWGVILLECSHAEHARQAFVVLQRTWAEVPIRIEEAAAQLAVDELAQMALEHSWQRAFGQMLQASHPNNMPKALPKVQMMFCIDVRSEPMRRAIESHSESIATKGFAGFFGLPVAYTPVGTALRRPQLPGLLAPSMEVSEVCVPAIDSVKGQSTQAEDVGIFVRSRQNHLKRAAQWGQLQRWPGAVYSYVEAMGFGYLPQLLRGLYPGSSSRRKDDRFGLSRAGQDLCRPRLIGVAPSEQIKLAAGVLQAMELPEQMAELVVFVGHGSQTANNAHAAALDCGACCGQTGEVNARTLALLLNDAEIRRGLGEYGIEIPEKTWFLAGLHNTTTDEFEWFDQDLLPHQHASLLAELCEVCEQAADQVRRTRARVLGMDVSGDPVQLLKSFRRRANDPAQTRPEWGLAGNAAFIIAARKRTLGLDLKGRCFLHDYQPESDPQGNRLESLMTAPMLVTHWISAQYHASTCDPERMGSGNKVLHNVVGGHIGVFEGNGGDLRIGLSRQSLHNGHAWVHEPLRLSVVIDAPAERIEQIVQRHEVLRNLVHHHWLYLMRLEGQSLYLYWQGQWQAVAQ